METRTFKVPNIGCDGCVKKIQQEVGQITGVTEVTGSKDTRMVTVTWESPASWQMIETRLIEIDYPAVER